MHEIDFVVDQSGVRSGNTFTITGVSADGLRQSNNFALNKPVGFLKGLVKVLSTKFETCVGGIGSDGVSNIKKLLRSRKSLFRRGGYISLVCYIKKLPGGFISISIKIPHLQ